MPTVTKQRPLPSANGPPPVLGPPDSMLSRGVPVARVSMPLPRTYLFYGINRVGKTSLACQFPRPLALVSFEPSPFTGGATSVVKIPGVTYYKVVPSTAVGRAPDLPGLIPGTMAAMRLAEELAEDFMSGRKMFKTVVVDGGTSVQDVALCELMDLPELPAQMKVAKSKEDRSYGVATSENYMDRSAKAKEILRKFLNVPTTVVILAKERDHNPPKDDKGNVRRDKLTRGLQLESFVAPDLGQATTGWLMDACQCMCRMYVADETKIERYNVNGQIQEQVIGTGKMTRRLLLQLQTNFAAGVQCANPDLPDWVEGNTAKKLYDELIRVLSL